MHILRKYWNFAWIMLLVLAMLSGCALGGQRVTQFHDTYEYSTKNKTYVQPAIVDGWVKRDALTTTTEDGTFFCFTIDTAQANDFVNAQRMLLHFLAAQGVEIGEMTFYGTDYGYSFSESGDRAAYVDLTSVRSWEQVLVTLQALWGDYTDYGYVYAMANAIAATLDWKTDSVPNVDEDMLDAFFTENPAAIHLLYPTFTAQFSSKEMAANSKALATRLFTDIRWRKALAKPIKEQLDDYYVLVSSYTQDLSVPFTRQTCGYAYYGKNIPLRIMTTYAELLIDADYEDIEYRWFGDYFSDYVSIYETANTIETEISAAVAYFGLENTAGVVTMKWMDSNDPATATYVQTSGKYYSSTHTAYLRSIYPCLHEYYHHIEYLFTQNNPRTWQSQAFCEIGTAHSRYPNNRMDQIFETENYAELFVACTGRTYRPGGEDFFEASDIACLINNDYQLDYNSSGPQDSMVGYLIGLYGERMASEILLFPETVEDVTGKTWAELETQWKQNLQNKYADVELPDRVSN